MNAIEIYKGKNDQTHVEVKFDQETVWLSQKQMAHLFTKSLKTVNEHIKNIFREHELERPSTIRNFQIVAESKPDDKEIMIKLIVNLMTSK